MAHVFVLSPSGGVLQGDRYRTDIELKNGATYTSPLRGQQEYTK